MLAGGLKLRLARRLQLEVSMNIDASSQLNPAVPSVSLTQDARVLPQEVHVLDKVVSRCKTPLIEVIQRGFALYSALPPVAQKSSNGDKGKMPPLREFAQEHGLALSTYWRLISTYLLYRRFPEIAHYRHLGVAHLSVILGVEEECQLYFIRMTEICRWSRRVLEQEVKAYHRNWQWAGRSEQNRHTSKLRAVRLAS